MSIHAQLTEEAAKRLRQQERKSQILSVVIACLSIILIAGILALFAIPMMIQETPTIVTYSAELDEQQDLEEKKVVQQTQRKPAAPSQNMAKVIAANTASPTAIPVPEVEVSEPSLHFGDDIDFGQGWGDDNVLTGGGGSFGSTDPASGGLQGYLYDLKQLADKSDSGQVPLGNNNQSYPKLIHDMAEKNFAADAMKPYFKAPTPLYLTHLGIAKTRATLGPEVFQASETVEPRYWIVHYSGMINPPKTGAFRFFGTGDNILIVRINDKPVFDGSGYYAQPVPNADSQRYPSPMGGRFPFRYGAWMNMRANETVKIDIIIGEGMGGDMGFILQMEERGVNYKKADDGRPILPLFSTAPILEHEQEELKKEFGNFEIEFDLAKALIFSVRR